MYNTRRMGSIAGVSSCQPCQLCQPAGVHAHAHAQGCLSLDLPGMATPSSSASSAAHLAGTSTMAVSSAQHVPQAGVHWGGGRGQDRAGRGGIGGGGCRGDGGRVRERGSAGVPAALGVETMFQLLRMTACRCRNASTARMGYVCHVHVHPVFRWAGTLLNRIARAALHARIHLSGAGETSNACSLIACLAFCTALQHIHSLSPGIEAPLARATARIARTAARSTGRLGVICRQSRQK